LLCGFSHYTEKEYIAGTDVMEQELLKQNPGSKTLLIVDVTNSYMNKATTDQGKKTVEILTKALHLSEKYCDDIELFAPMHDIGKVGILDSILLAERKLTPGEFNEMKNHTIFGYNIVKGKKELDMVAAITLKNTI
jgi:response regulator RpfG family c-di-GMP phosphodiesterase